MTESPSFINKGTWTSSPVSKVAGFKALVAVFPLCPGSVWITLSTVFEGKSRLIQKKTIGYNKDGKISRIHDYDMLKPGENGKPILISIITYEYD